MANTALLYSPTRADLVLATSLLAVPWSLRLISLQEKALSPASGDAIGFLSDLGVALLAWALIGGARRYGRLPGVLLGWGWVILNGANYEYIRTFDAVGSLRYANYLTDSTFMTGSALHVTHPLWLIVLAAVLTPLIWLTQPRHRIWPAAMVGIALLGGLHWSVTVPAVTSWRLQHPVAATLRQATRQATATPGEAAPDNQPPAELSADLSGSPITSLGQKHNVLLVMLEGVTGGYLPSLANHHGLESDIRMTQLDQHAQRGLTFRHFISQQRQTNRGTYASLCGDLPRLGTGQARMTDYASGTAAPNCLPQALADAGYRTAYLQAAPLAFMMKDTFMPMAGFQHVEGNAALDQAYQRSAWGVDDRAFLEQSIERIARLREGESPWFLTLLTAGTHHPYNLPDGAGGEEGTDRQRAFRYMDRAIGHFLDTLKERGWLDDTLVLITSDEAAGLASGQEDLTRQLSQNWGFLTALLPGGDGTFRDTPFAQSDIALSVMDYLGLASDKSGFLGRSLFRDYATSRDLYFANTYAGQVYALTDDALVLCPESLEGCETRPRQGPSLEALGAPRPTQAATRDALKATVAYSQRPLSPGRDDASVQLMAEGAHTLPRDADRQLLFGGQYLTLPADTRVRMELDVTVQGRDGVQLTHDINDAQGSRRHVPLPVLDAGDRLVLTYTLPLDEATQRLESLLQVSTRTPGKGTLEVHKARLSTAPMTLYERLFGVEGKDTSLEVIRQNDVQRYSMLDTPTSRQDACLSSRGSRLVGADCQAGDFLLFGGYLNAPAGARVDAVFDVSLGEGEASLKADLVSGLGEEQHATSSPITLQGGERRTLHLTGQLPDRRVTEHLEARLALSASRQDKELVVHDAWLELHP